MARNETDAPRLHFQTAIIAVTGQSLPTFETASQRLALLPRLFIEPDGSFVWRVDPPTGQSWQLDGNLIDRGPCLDRVELSGACPEESLSALLAALGWPQLNLRFELPRQGTVLDEQAFRLLAATPSGAI